MKLTKNRFLLAFSAIVGVLAIIRLAFPQVSGKQDDQEYEEMSETHMESCGIPSERDGLPHRIWSVPNYQTAFPDSQSAQIIAAEKWGVKPVRDRDDAEKRKKELVYMGESPYYHVDRLNNSIPYLVPRASLLLEDIGKAFYDSLYVKGIPLNQLIVTSVLRTEADVTRLQRHNGNATDRSCHLFGTTFDICYNRYQPITREVRNDTLKWVLSEVLRDKRAEGRCYIKYEVKQGCFHMTVR